MPEDPDVVALTERARTLEQQLRGTATAYLDGLTRQTAALDTELARTERDLARLPGQESEYARLERGPKVLGEMLTLLQTRLKEAEIAEAVQDPSVQPLDAATLPTRPLRPRPARDVPLAAGAGLLLGLAGVLLRERLDRTVRTRDDVQAWARLPVLGVIPRSPAPAAPALGRGRPDPGARRALPPAGGASRREQADLVLLEAFARLQARVAFAHGGARPHTIVVTSPLSGEGKTSTAGNLARAVAHTGSRTLLVDADLQRGTLHRRFGVARGPGMSELLAGTAAFDDVVHRVDVGGGVTLAVIPAGAPAGPERRLLTTARTAEVLKLAAARFENVIVDSPPLNLTADATVLAGAADGVLLVTRAGQTPLDALAHAAQHLEGARATTLGVVVNDVDPVRDSAYDAEYRYYADPYFQTAEAR
jgi:tyrosine-protein kinase Etk/Wzc